MCFHWSIFEMTKKRHFEWSVAVQYLSRYPIHWKAPGSYSVGFILVLKIINLDNSWNLCVCFILEVMLNENLFSNCVFKVIALHYLYSNLWLRNVQWGPGCFIDLLANLKWESLNKSKWKSKFMKSFRITAHEDLQCRFLVTFLSTFKRTIDCIP